MNRFYTQFLWLLPVLLALAVNANVLQNGFGWDDEQIIDHLKPGGWSSVLSLRTDTMTSQKIRHTYFRPLITASYKMDRLIWGKSPFGFHFSVWLVHGLNTLLVFLLAQRLMKSGPARGPAPAKTDAAFNSGRNALRPYMIVPLIAASLFAVHPAHAEAIAWIAGRNDVYCTFFLLLSFLVFIQSRRTGSRALYSVSMLSYFLALLAKEAAVFFFVLFPLYDYLTSDDPPGRLYVSRLTSYASPLTTFAFRSLPPVLVLGVYLFLRSTAMESTFGGVPSGIILSQSYIARALAAFGFYLRLMILPYPHRPFITDLPDSPWFIGLSALALFLLAGVFLKALIRREVLSGLSLGWMLTVLAPAVAVTLMRVTPTEAAERYVYGASVGCIFLVVGWIDDSLDGISPALPLRRRLNYTAGLLVLILIASWGSESRARNGVWNDYLSFWQAATADGPNSGFPYRELGIQYANRGRYGPAEQSYLRAIEIDGKNPGPEDRALGKDLNSLGVLYYELGRYPRAEEMYHRALMIRRKNAASSPLEAAETLNNLGNLKQAEGHLKEAAEFYQRAIIIRKSALGSNDPDIAETLNNIGALYERMGDTEKAEAHYKRALEIRKNALRTDHPDVAQTLNNLGALYYSQGRLDEAEVLYKRAVQIYETDFRLHRPDLAHTLYNLGALYDTRGEYALAETLYQRSVSILETMPGGQSSALSTVLESYSAMLRKMNRAEDANQMDGRAGDSEEER